MAARPTTGMEAWLVANTLLLLLFNSSVLADPNQNLHIKKLCNRNRLPMPKKIDGAVLHSDGVQRIDCLITFHTDSVLQRFMLRFENLRLDCNDHLYIYDGTNTFGNFKFDLSCGHNKQNVGIIYTESNQVSLKYVTDNWLQQGNGFKLVLTAIKHTKDITGGVCLGFVCRNNFCIANDLLCDGVNHCNDNSDESSALALCLDEGSVGNVLGLGMNIFVAIVVSIFSICFICIVGVVICICRRQRLRAAAGAHIVVSSGHPSYPMQHGYPPTSGSHPEKPPPYPGNMFSPAGGIGYNTHQGSIYYPTK